MPEDLPLDPAKVDAFLAELKCGEIEDLLVTLNLVTTLCLVQPTEHNFAARDVVHIESRWTLVAADWTQGGFVASLRDGRRVHLQYFIEDLASQDNVRNHSTTWRQSALSCTGGAVGCIDDVDVLNEFLERLAVAADARVRRTPF